MHKKKKKKHLTVRGKATQQEEYLTTLVALNFHKPRPYPHLKEQIN